MTMRQRSLDANGDYSFGTGLPFLVDSPACVAQAIMTRLRLMTGEWFLDTSDGTPYDGSILGHNTGATRDIAIQARILETPQVLQIDQYVSFVDTSRAMTAAAQVDTTFGKAIVTTIF